MIEGRKDRFCIDKEIPCPDINTQCDDCPNGGDFICFTLAELALLKKECMVEGAKMYAQFAHGTIPGFDADDAASSIVEGK